MNSNQECNIYIQALRFLKEWSTALVVIQTGLLAVIGGLLKVGSFSEVTIWLAISLISFSLSILVAASVIGAIPRIIQQLAVYIEKYKSIYRIRNALGIPIWVLTSIQHILFAVGIISFVVFILLEPN